MNLFALRTVFLLLLLLALPFATGGAQSRQGKEVPDELFRTISSLDSAVFDAFNRCDLKTFATFFADDIEFYHDKNGLSRSRESLIESVKNNICGKVRRDLIPGTLEVYPIPGHGAVEIGAHRFYEKRSGKDDVASGEAKFMHIWQNKDGAWKITRVISYAHYALQK